MPTFRGISAWKCPLLVFLASCSVLIGAPKNKKPGGGGAGGTTLTSTAPTLQVKSSFTEPEAIFTSDSANHSYYECRVDGAMDTWTICSSPLDLTAVVTRGYEGLFRVRSVSTSGLATADVTRNFRMGYASAGLNNSVYAVAYTADGGKLLGGTFTAYGVEYANRAAALTSTGAYHSILETFDGNVNAIVEQTDGKILAGGLFTAYATDTTAPDKIIRLNADGTADTAFNTNAGAGFDAAVNAIAVQSNGKILVGGAFTTYAGAGAPDGLVRLNSDGTLDTSFSTNAGAGFDGTVNAIAVQGDGKILVGGAFTSYAGVDSPDNIVRLNTDGTVDMIFSTNTVGGFDAAVNAIAVQGDGKILVGGTFATYAGAATPNAIVRLATDGAVDAAFNGSAGSGFDTAVNAIAIQANDKILIGGNFNNYSSSATPGHIVRLDDDGTLDAAFSTNAGAGLDSPVNTIAIQADQKILVGGDFATYDNAAAPDKILRLNDDGSLDSAFSSHAGIGFDAEVKALWVKADEGLLVGGQFSTYSGDDTIPTGIIKLKADNTIDTTFRTNAGTGFNNTVYSIAVQDDGKFLVGGAFTSYAGNAGAPDAILRLNANGSVDTAFSTNAGTGFDFRVEALALQNDGKIVVGGNFSAYNGNASISDKVARLNADGSEDTIFSTGAGTGTNGLVSALLVLPDAKILVGGVFTSFDGDTGAPNGLVRLNTDGTIDSAFSANAGTGAGGAIEDIARQSDGKIVLVGGLMDWNGHSSYYGVRLNVDGTWDATFNGMGSAGCNDGLLAVAVTADDKILIGGNCTSYYTSSWNPSRYLLKLNVDGTADTSFVSAIGAGFDRSPVYSIVVKDGKVLVGGDFSRVGTDVGAMRYYEIP